MTPLPPSSKPFGESDLTNLARLRLGFPDLIDVFDRYRNEAGYWEALWQRSHPTPTPADDLGNLIEGE